MRVVSAPGGRGVAGDTSRGGRGERVALWLHPAESQASHTSPAITLGTGGETETRRGRGSGRQRLQPGTPPHTQFPYHCLPHRAGLGSGWSLDGHPAIAVIDCLIDGAFGGAGKE